MQNIFGHYCKSKLDKVAKPRLAAILPLANPEGSLWKEQELKNPGEVTRMLFALSGDRRYLEYVPFMETGGGKRMCEALDKAERTGIE